jgi:hypothetical protein
MITVPKSFENLTAFLEVRFFKRLPPGKPVKLLTNQFFSLILIYL